MAEDMTKAQFRKMQKKAVKEWMSENGHKPFAPDNWEELESPLKPVLDGGVFVEPKDKGKASELSRQGAWVADMRRHSKQILVNSIPNGTHIKTMAGRRKADREGRYAGYPDTDAKWAPRKVACLEWKDGQGDPTDAQIECMNRLVAMGIPCGIFRTKECANRWLASLGAPVLKMGD